MVPTLYIVDCLKRKKPNNLINSNNCVKKCKTGETCDMVSGKCIKELKQITPYNYTGLTATIV